MMDNIFLFHVLNVLELLIFIFLTIEIYEVKKKLKSVEENIQKQELRKQIIYSD